MSGGVAYHGRIAALAGKFVFGDIVRGRLFAADLAAMKRADDGIPSTIAPVEEIQLVVPGAHGQPRARVVQGTGRATRGATMARADLHIGQSGDGEIFVTSRQDGTIRMLVP